MGWQAVFNAIKQEVTVLQPEGAVLRLVRDRQPRGRLDIITEFIQQPDLDTSRTCIEVLNDIIAYQ